MSALAKRNPHLRFVELRQLAPMGFATPLSKVPCEEILEQLAALPCPEGIEYRATVAEWDSLAVTSLLGETVFGGMPIQHGYCMGHNKKLNALEWHKGPEVLIAGTDLLLFLDRFENIQAGLYHPTNLRACEIPKGTALEIHAGTLHFAPLETSGDGFRASIVLPRGTNTPLDVCDRDREPFLFQRNKWIVAHPESPAAGRGAPLGIQGSNITII